MNAFWDLVGSSSVHDSRSIDLAVERLTERLDAVSVQELVEFVGELREVLGKLDRVEFSRIPVRFGGHGFPQTADHFLYARCACILAGREAYRAVLQSASEFERFVGPFTLSAEKLLYAAGDLYERKTGGRMKEKRNISLE